MTKKSQKNLIFFLVLLFLLANSTGVIKLILAQENRELEVKYPPVTGLKPTTVDFPITGYVKYIFNFAIAIVGLIALGVLIFSGIQYLTSAGKPETLKSAKSRIKSAFLGILILLFSYLILFTINPQLIIFKLPGLEEIILTPLEMPPPEERIPELLGKVKEIANNVKFISGKIKSLAEEICIVGLFSQLPVSDIEKIIQEKQLALLAFRYEILYYKNRAFAEGDDLVLELTKLGEESEYYEGMRQIETEAEVKEYYEEKKKEVDKEIELKTQLLEKLNNLVSLITRISDPIKNIGMMNYCCDPNFKDCGESFIEIQIYHGEIEKVCNEILETIEKIIKLKTIYI